RRAPGRRDPRAGHFVFRGLWRARVRLSDLDERGGRLRWRQQTRAVPNAFPLGGLAREPATACKRGSGAHPFVHRFPSATGGALGRLVQLSVAKATGGAVLGWDGPAAASALLRRHPTPFARPATGASAS